MTRTYNRPSAAERVAEHQRKTHAALAAGDARQDERDALALKLVHMAESLRTDAHLDVRHVYRLDIALQEDGSATVVCHSRVFPSYQHTVSTAALAGTDP